MWLETRCIIPSEKANDRNNSCHLIFYRARPVGLGCRPTGRQILEYISFLVDSKCIINMYPNQKCAETHREWVNEWDGEYILLEAASDITISHNRLLQLGKILLTAVCDIPCHFVTAHTFQRSNIGKYIFFCSCFQCFYSFASLDALCAAEDVLSHFPRWCSQRLLANGSFSVNDSPPHRYFIAGEKCIAVEKKSAQIISKEITKWPAIMCCAARARAICSSVDFQGRRYSTLLLFCFCFWWQPNNQLNGINHAAY